MVADWQESFRAESPELLTPLLDKNDDGAASASKSKSAPKKRETQTVKALLMMSAVDTPLLLLAFAAGDTLLPLSWCFAQVAVIFINYSPTSGVVLY